MREPLSVVVTTFNSERTLGECLASVAWADELVVLDSGSHDATLEIAGRSGARIAAQPFRGYARQKQDAIDRASHRWVLLLDSDESLAPGAREVIEAALVAPQARGFELPRHEQVFWQPAHRHVRRDRFLRLFDRDVSRMSADAVHESPQCAGRVLPLDALLLHRGQPDIETKIDKLNRYSSLAVDDEAASGREPLGSRWRMLWYPSFVFWRQYLFKRHILNGWAGFIAARSMAFHAFLKDAKRLERHYQKEKVPKSGRR